MTMKSIISEGHEIISLKDESAPLLKNQLLDKFTRVKWYVPLLIYIPIILFFLYKGNIQLSSSIIVFNYVLGIFMWTLTEYVFHRFVFHFVPKSKIGKQLHFILHGVHHAYPNDSLRLVMPPGLSIPLSSMFCILFYFIFGKYFTVIFAGFMSAYLVYDMLHFAVHHVSAPDTKWFNSKKIRHMKHHYLHSETEFAVTSPYWDRIFNTFCKKADSTVIK
jgi:sterol desaturase/sphingolipid hydroxylase (fatty acid hydroxylase superfamily)